MKTILLLWCSLACIAMAIGEKFPTLKANGKEYTDVVVKAVEADGIKIVHSAGLAKIPYEQLPDEVRKMFNFDPKKAEQAREINAQLAKKVAADEHMRRFDEEATKSAKKTARHLKGRVLSVAKTGVLLTDIYFQDGPNKGYTGVSWEAWVSGQFDVVDGQGVESDVYPIGNKQYNAVSGAQRTVRAFTVSIEAFKNYVAKEAMK